MIAFARLIIAASFAACASACVSMPDFDAVEGTPEEFKQELANIDGYPVTANTPRTPADVPAAAVFDRRANALLARSDTFDQIESVPIKTASDLEAARRQLLAMVNAYKLDDPQ